MSNAASFFQAKTLSWQRVFVIGVAGFGLAGLKAWWASPSAVYQAPVPVAPLAAVVPATVPSAAVTKLLKTVPPVSSFTPSRLAPADLPPALSGLSRPPPDPEPYVAPIGVQPGYVIPEGPQPREIR